MLSRIGYLPGRLAVPKDVIAGAAAQSRSGEERRVAVQHAQDLIPAFVGDLEYGAVDTGLFVFPQCRLVRRGAEHRGRQRLGVTPLLFGHPAQPRELFPDLVAAAGTREPAVAIFDDAAQRVIALAAEDDRRVRLLRRLRPRPHLIEIDHLAVVFRLVLGPQRLHREDPLAHQLEPRVVAGSVIFHLLDIPAAADTEDKAPARQLIEAGDTFGGDGRVALGYEAIGGAEQQLFGRRRREGQRDERIVRMRIALRQFAAARKRALAAGRNVGVLGHKQRFEAALFESARQFDDVDPVIGREIENADLHLSPPHNQLYRDPRECRQATLVAAGGRSGATSAEAGADRASVIACAAAAGAPVLAGAVCKVKAPEAKVMPFSANTR